ncbi:MAG: ATP-binding cassette domain-containing protein [Nitrospira sp.]|nr:ATP-binding cassette domain-containing protein [Nitrospira sp.]
MASPLLRIHNLTFAVEGRTILDRLNLAIEPCEIHALLGANGSGKTTLAYLLMGCEGYRPTGGTVVFAGTDLLTLPIHERAKLGLTLAWQEPARFEGITVREYLTLGHAGGDPEWLLKLVGLDPDRYVDRLVDKTLSGGELTGAWLADVFLGARVRIDDQRLTIAGAGFRLNASADTDG